MVIGWCCLLLLLGGCAIAGIAAQALPPATVPPAYRGLQNQTIAVMLWVERGIRIDHPNLQADTAAAVQTVMRRSGVRELEGAEFPVDPRSIIRYQHEHPRIENLPITDVAPVFGVSRLIYIEIEEFATRSEVSMDLYRGSMVASLQVIEIEDGQAKVAYEENDVTAIFPRGVPPEGIPHANDYRMYLGTIETFAAEVMKRFMRHEAER